MVVEDFLNFGEWLPAALWVFLYLTAALIVLGTFVGYLVAAFRHGPGEGFYVVAQVIGGAIPDFLGTSPRRVWAIARLAILEAYRRRIVIVTFALFALAMLFGGWFMNAGSDHPDQLYLNFVLWGTQLLVLMMGILIAAFSLPDDIKNKTIYTVVTKPVQSTEIVLGRIVGFACIGTAMIAAMGLMSYVFVWLGLSHTHQIVGESQTMASLEPVAAEGKRLNRLGQRVSDNAIMEGESTFEAGHRHMLEVIEDIRPADLPPLDDSNVVSRTTLPDGRIIYKRLIVNEANGHTHRVQVTGEGDNAQIQVGPSDGYFRARIPAYASSLRFFDSEGNENQKGIDVGKEWNHRGFIDGGTNLNRNSLSKAEFIFDNISLDRFSNPELLILELDLGVFRTFKGDIETRVIGSLQFESLPQNPDVEPIYRSDKYSFETAEFQVQIKPIRRQIEGEIVQPGGVVAQRGDFDFFEHYAKNNRVKVILRCEDQNQYLGAARENVYFRARDGVYWVNFAKGFLGIWTQMLVVVSIGVAFSTFLSAAVTVVGTLVALVVGFSTPFIRGMMDETNAGGGPIESFYRVITQKNMEVELEPGVATTLLENCDMVLVNMLSALTYVAPNFKTLNFSDFLMYGYSIDIHRVSAAVAIALSFCVGFAVFGYFCLKTREIAK